MNSRRWMGRVLGFYGSEGGTCFTVWKLELELELESILGVKVEDDRGVSTIHLRWTCRVLEHTVS
jgi:hypothetical protein